MNNKNSKICFSDDYFQRCFSASKSSLSGNYKQSLSKAKNQIEKWKNVEDSNLILNQSLSLLLKGKQNEWENLIATHEIKSFQQEMKKIEKSEAPIQ